MKLDLSKILRAVAPVVKTVAVAIVAREATKAAAKTGVGAVVAGAVVDAIAGKRVS